MEKTELQILFAYNRWSNAKVLTACQGLEEQQLHAPAAVSFGSLFGTLLHIYGAEVLWRMRLEDGVSPTKMPDQMEIPDLPTLLSIWQAEEIAIQTFLERLTGEDLNRVVAFQRLNGAMETTTIWKALLHLLLHSMQFRAEAGILLTSLHRSPGDLDFIFYLRDQNLR